METIQIVRALTWPGYGWANHPAVLMWKGFEEALGRYGFTCCEVWTEHGFGDTCAPRSRPTCATPVSTVVRTQPELAAARRPAALAGGRVVHRSHQSSLLRKDPGHYRPLFPDVPVDLPYVWPVRSEAVLAAERRKAEKRAETAAAGRGEGPGKAERARRRSRAAKQAWQTRGECRPAVAQRPR